MVSGRDGDAALVITVGVEERDRASEVKVGTKVKHRRGAQGAEVDAAHHLTIRAALMSHPQLYQIIVRHCGEIRRG